LLAAHHQELFHSQETEEAVMTKSKKVTDANKKLDDSQTF
jgi:hypothetical protein